MDTDLLEPGGNCRGGEKLSEPEYIIKVKPTEFANKLDLECERNIVVRDDSVFDLRNQKAEIVINRCEKDNRERKGQSETQFWT